MHWSKWIILAIALFQGCWFVFDGSRALISGDYTTPKTGSHAGQLGPWSKLVSSIGLDPRGTLMKCVHVAVGFGWLIALSLLLMQKPASHIALIACSVGSLWYLPLGTILSLAELGLLLFL